MTYQIDDAMRWNTKIKNIGDYADKSIYNYRVASIV